MPSSTTAERWSMKSPTCEPRTRREPPTRPRAAHEKLHGMRGAGTQERDANTMKVRNRTQRNNQLFSVRERLCPAATHRLESRYRRRRVATTKARRSSVAVGRGVGDRSGGWEVLGADKGGKGGDEVGQGGETEHARRKDLRVA